jgi:hypothetical protein
MAEYWTEGLLERLTDAADPISKQLLAAATFYVVPRINPDGCFRGHLRYILLRHITANKILLIGSIFSAETIPLPDMKLCAYAGRTPVAPTSTASGATARSPTAPLTQPRASSDPPCDRKTTSNRFVFHANNKICQDRLSTDIYPGPIGLNCSLYMAGGLPRVECDGCRWLRLLHRCSRRRRPRLQLLRKVRHVALIIIHTRLCLCAAVLLGCSCV